MKSRRSASSKKRIWGVLQLSAGATMISFSAVFVKLAHVGPTMAGFYRTLFGGLMLSALLIIRRKPLFRGTRSTLLFLVCGLFFALDLTLWHRSIHYVGPGLATLLSNFQVFFLAVFGITALGEKFTWKLAFSIPLAMTGLYLLVGVNWNVLGATYKAGVLLGLGTALFYSVYILTLRKSQSGSPKGSSLSVIAVISLFTALIMGTEAWVQGESFFIPDLRSWMALLGYGLMGQVLGWVILSKGLPKVEASSAGLILLLQPTLSFVWDIVLFSRPVMPVEMIGAIIALAAIYLGTTVRG